MPQKEKSKNNFPVAIVCLVVLILAILIGGIFWSVNSSSVPGSSSIGVQGGQVTSVKLPTTRAEQISNIIQFKTNLI